MRLKTSRTLLSYLLGLVLLISVVPRDAMSGVTKGVLKTGTETDGGFKDGEIHLDIIRPTMKLLLSILPNSNRLRGDSSNPELDRREDYYRVAAFGVGYNTDRKTGEILSCDRSNVTTPLLVRDLPIGDPLNQFKTPRLAIAICKPMIDMLYDFSSEGKNLSWIKGYFARSIVNEISHHFGKRTAGGSLDFAKKVICEDKEYSSEFGTYCTDNKIASISLRSSWLEGGKVAGAYWSGIHQKIYALTASVSEKIFTPEEVPDFSVVRGYVTTKYSGIELDKMVQERFLFQIDRIDMRIENLKIPSRSCSLIMEASVRDEKGRFTDRVLGTIEVWPAVRCANGNLNEKDITRLFEETLINLRSEVHKGDRSPGFVINQDVEDLSMDFRGVQKNLQPFYSNLSAALEDKRKFWTPGYNSFFWENFESFSVGVDNSSRLISLKISKMDIRFDGKIGFVEVEIKMDGIDGGAATVLSKSKEIYHLGRHIYSEEPAQVLVDTAMDLVGELVEQSILGGSGRTCELQLDDSGEGYLNAHLSDLQGEDLMNYLFRLKIISPREKSIANKKLQRNVIREVVRPRTQLERRYAKKCGTRLNRMKLAIAHHLRLEQELMW